MWELTCIISLYIYLLHSSMSLHSSKRLYHQTDTLKLLHLYHTSNCRIKLPGCQYCSYYHACSCCLVKQSLDILKDTTKLQFTLTTHTDWIWLKQLVWFTLTIKYNSFTFNNAGKLFSVANLTSTAGYTATRRARLKRTQQTLNCSHCMCPNCSHCMCPNWSHCMCPNSISLIRGDI